VSLDSDHPQGRNARRLAGLPALKGLRRLGPDGKRRDPRRRGPVSKKALENLPDTHHLFGEDWTGANPERSPEQVARLAQLRAQFTHRPWYVCGYRPEAIPTILRRAFGVVWSHAVKDRRPTLRVPLADYGDLSLGVVISHHDLVGVNRGTVFFIPDPGVGPGDQYLTDTVHHDEDYRSVVAYVDARNRGIGIVNRKSLWERRVRRLQHERDGTTAPPYMLAVNLREWLLHNWNG
jgi:hypothetical protein